MREKLLTERYGYDGHGTVRFLASQGSSDASLVASTTPSGLRRDYNGWVGLRLQVGSSPLLVSSLGRWIVSGNTGTHTVKLVRADGTDLPGASASVNTAGAPAGQYKYASLGQTVTLQANTVYYLVSQEVSGGDYWYNNPTVVTPTAAATFTGSVYAANGTQTYYVSPTANHSYVPVSLKYSTAATVTDTYSYDAFGILIDRKARRTSDGVLVSFADPSSETAPAGTTPTVNFYRYTGEQWDSDLGMYYLRARYYRPQIGRFWTMDTIQGRQEEPLSLHKYLYAQCNPVNRIDPSGLTDFSLTLVYGATGWKDWQLGAQMYYETADGVGQHLPGRRTSILISPIQPDDNLLDRVRGGVESEHLTVGTDRIVKIIIAGHGAEGGGNLGGERNGASDLTLENLDDSARTPQSKMLDYLKPFTQGNCDVQLRACYQAQTDRGKAMMALIARRLGATVTGYDDQYAIWGWGNRWTVDSKGKWTGKKGDDLEHGWLNQTVNYLSDIGWNYIGF